MQKGFRRRMVHDEKVARSYWCKHSKSSIANLVENRVAKKLVIKFNKQIEDEEREAILAKTMNVYRREIY